MAQGDPWGADTAPLAAHGPVAPLSPRLQRLADIPVGRQIATPTGFSWPNVRELPEVAAAQQQGWTALPPDLAWAAWIPAVWPAQHRAWLPDRLPRVQRDSGSVARLNPHWWQDERDEAVATCARVGLPAPPVGRIWLVRSPWPELATGLIVGHLYALAMDEDTASASVVESLAVTLSGTIDDWLERFPGTRR